MEPRKLRVALMVHDHNQELEFWYPLLRLRETGVEVKVIGALSESSTILARAGLLKGKRVSAAPDVEIALAASGIVTSRDPNDIPAFFRKFSETLAAAA